MDEHKIKVVNVTKIFNNEEFGELRTVKIENQIYFIGVDVARALGYSNASKAISTHCKHTIKIMLEKPDSQNGNVIKTKSLTTIINEGDIYRLIIKSKLESSQKFESWVMDEVLPQIRQTGGYIPVKEEDSESEIMAKALLIAQKTLDKKDAIIAQKNKQLEEQKPLVEFANQVSDSTNLISMGEMAKLLKEDKIDIGRNRLLQWLREKKILMKNNIPYQKYIDSGYFNIKESVYYLPNGEVKTNTTTYVTGKGQLYLTKKVKNEYNK